MDIHNVDISRLDLNLLRVFEAVSHEKSVSRAANRLGLSQPAVSSAITRLRRSLGDPLFVRTSHGMQPTQLGERLLGPVETALELIRSALVQPNAAFDPARSDRSFTLLLTDMGERIYLGTMMRTLMRVAPGIKLQVRRLSYGRVADALETGIADLAVGYLSHLIGGLVYQRLYISELACLVRRGHPQIGSRLSRAQYLSSLHVVEASRSPADGFVTKILASVGVTRQFALSVPHFLAMPAIAAQTDLIATLPRRLVPLVADRGKLRVFPLPIDVPRPDVGMCWSPQRQDDIAHRWLRETFARLFADDSPQ
ncbi:MAG: LysR family transcriptional regulator [Rhodospirillaceae bacterium]|nr:LysR family transcriptional regulator [Rhodospirillaceae bacterium]